MSTSFDLIVVGAGPSGSAAALVAARAGLSVVLVERGVTPGSKNMFGGVIYTHSLKELLPDFAERAPLERGIIRRAISICSAGKVIAAEYEDATLAHAPYNSFSVIRGRFDQWLAGQARNAGAKLVCQTVADELTLGKTTGVEGVRLRDGTVLRAPLVICADGVNSLLACRAGLRPVPDSRKVALGVKKTLLMPAGVLEERFGVGPRQGVDRIYIGDFTKGIPGGGFLYTNRDTLSVGVTVTVADLRDSRVRPEQILDLFMMVPDVARLVEGLTVAEYSAHLIPEGGFDALPQIVHPGVLLIGDAAGFVLNTGLNLEGANLAITSGRLAGEAAVAAHGARDFSGPSLRRYERSLQNSHVLADLKMYRSSSKFLGNPRIFKDYPRLVAAAVEDIVRADGSPKRTPGRQVLRQAGGMIGWRAALRDVFAARGYF
jgi:electron transfer flavoprotein-quinone oxidoreductase